MKNIVNRALVAKKRFLLAISIQLSVFSLFAADITPNEAIRIANDFVQHDSTAKANIRKAPAGTRVKPSIAHKMPSRVAQNKDNVYVINLGGDQGFVVVSGETGAESEILGYCDHGSFNYEEAPIQLQDLLKQYADEVDSLRQNPALAAKTPRRARDIGFISVGPLLTTTWSQWAPYNNQCPAGCPSGCVPTAIAQIMNYWKWPHVSQGNLLDRVTGQPTGADFSGHVYDWDNMLDDYSAGYTAEQAAAVAKLMADIGTAWGTAYSSGPEGSATDLSTLQFSNNFGYDPDIEHVSANIQVRMKNELDQLRPVVYTGHSVDNTGVHSLVCDGYTSANYFHFNYGWGGYYDGWYKGALASRYPNSAVIWTGIRPVDGQRVTIGDMEYLLCPNGEAQIIQYVPTGVSNVVLEIPDTVVDSIGNAYTVTRIWKNAFYGRGHFSKLTIGGNIKSIHQFTFISSRIDTLVIGDKMEEVPDGAFQLTQIQHLTIGASVRRIGKQAFRFCRVGQVVNRSPGFEVDDEAFFEGGSGSTDGEWFKYITKLGSRVWASLGPRNFAVTPQFERLQEIKAEAFMSVRFPDDANGAFHIYPNLKIIHPGAFEGSYQRYFEVDEDNPYFSVMDNPGNAHRCMLFNKSKTSLVVCLPGNSSYPMGMVSAPYPENVVKLEPGSVAPKYANGTCARDFIIPKTVVEMEGAFKTCYNLYNLYCLAPVPPVVTDSTFNEKLWNWKVSDQTATLKVPEGTEELYRNAPGWRQFSRIEGVTYYGYNENYLFDLTPPQHQYDMVVHYSDEEGSRQMSVPVSEVNNIHVDEQENKFILSRTGQQGLTVDVDHVDSLCWKHSFVYDDAEAFELNDSTFTAEGQFCTVTFDPTVIDEDVTLYIRNAVLTPHVLDDQISGKGFDIALSNGAHELSGTVEIRVPMELGSNEFIAAGYFNEELGEWEPVYCKYDTVNGVATIRSNHLSQYFIFRAVCPAYAHYEDASEVIDQAMDFLIRPVFNAMMKVEWKYTSPNLYALDYACNELLRFMLSEEPEAQWAREAKTNLALMQSIGIDFLYSWISGVGEPWGFAPEKLNDIIGKLGYVTIAMNIMDVIDASIHDDNVGETANVLSAILNTSNMALTSTFATPVLSASMGCVALIGIGLNHLGTTMQAWQKEMFRVAYHYYYSVEGYREIAPASRYHDPQGTTGKKEYPHSYFRTPKDWFDYFYPAFQEGRMTEDRLFAYVEQSVRRYTERFWEDNQDARTWAYEWARNKGFFTLLFDTEALRNQISNEYYAELMNTTIPTVIESIKKELAVEAYERQRATMKSFSQEMNTKVTFRFIDSSCKKGEVSKYKNWQVQYAEIPETVVDPEDLVRTISEDGKASFSLTALAIVVHKLKPKMVLLNTNMVEQKTFDFEIPNGTNEVIVTIDIDKGGVEIEVPELKNLRLEYDPDTIDVAYTWAGTYNGQVFDQSTGVTPIWLDNRLNKKARFQTEIERFFKQHDFIYEDAYGHIKIGNDIMGNMENGQYKGTFTIDVTHPFTERTVSEYVEDFNKAEFGSMELYLPLLNGTIRHTIDCQFTVTPDLDGEGYTVSYTGEGIYDFTAEVVDRVDGVDFDNLASPQHVTVDQITTREVTQIGTVTLQYSLKLE